MTFSIMQPPAPAPFLFGAGKSREPGLIERNASFLSQHFGGLPVSGPVRMRGDSTSANLQAGVEPLLSTALLLLGTPQHARFFGSLIAPDIRKTSWRMGYWSWTGNEQLKVTAEGFERGFSVNRQRARFKGSRVETAMTRRGVETPLDVDEIRIADSALQMQAHATALSRDLAMLAVEYQKSLLFGAAASYPASHTTDATGSEWDATGGDSLTDINAAVDQLIAANQPYQRESIRAVMTYGARDAAFNDPTWLAARQAVRTEAYPTLEELRQYWGIGGIEVADAIYDPGTGTPISMWGDICVLFIDPRLQGGVISEWGRATFGVNFTFAGAVVSAPYYESRNTSNIYPFDSYDHPAMIQGAAGYLIHDVKEA